MDNTMKNNKGFTIIELMAVVAIVSILAVIGMAVYSDYAVRSKVSEALVFAAEAKTAVTGYYYVNREMPKSNAQAGLNEPDVYDRYDYIRKLELATTAPYGVITVTLKLPGTKSDRKLLQLVPSTMNGLMFWKCESPSVNGIDINQVPANCRG